MAYPSVRQQDEFFARIGLDPFHNNVEIVTVKTHDAIPMTVMYYFERDGVGHLAIHMDEESLNPNS